MPSRPIVVLKAALSLKLFESPKDVHSRTVGWNRTTPPRGLGACADGGCRENERVCAQWACVDADGYVSHRCPIRSRASVGDAHRADVDGCGPGFRGCEDVHVAHGYATRFREPLAQPLPRTAGMVIPAIG